MHENEEQHYDWREALAAPPFFMPSFTTVYFSADPDLSCCYSCPKTMTFSGIRFLIDQKSKRGFFNPSTSSFWNTRK
jgi:hypothetical protein